MKALLLSVALVAFSGAAWAQDTQQLQEPVVVQSEKLSWTPNRSLPKGVVSTSLLGESNKPGIYVRRHKFPANYRIPPHTHPDMEMVTVISGSLGVAKGEKYSMEPAAMLTAGGFFAMPAKTTHVVWTGPEETVIEVHSTSPTNIDYANPADDPRKAQ
ncbi:cupin domain-containing protein [Microvirga guangxiensis]|uniref:Cupin domain protein n=1 Tax=Microvirga guangxiensis TaxID=549386 RepID=A0A1G5FAM8_9HYPH|nr:cupin domain-containing protein [Microvirga guangxiensis]SCY36296.1 Cupin domain protein [Microvirga guangxiensis]